MRKNILFTVLAILLLICAGCSGNGNVKVYDDTEETTVSHDERTMTAVVTNIDLEHNIVGFTDCATGGNNSLIYHGGVTVSNSYGTEIGISGLSCGMVVDVDYYADTGKLVSMAVSDTVTVLKGINKFSVDLEKKKAVYKGTSCDMYSYVTAFDGSRAIDVMEINTEDQVTLYLFGGKLVSVVLELGHGYVRLDNQDSYIGGMVEVGYDVIVPVTDDMLLTVREGDYTLRINKNGYSGTKDVKVIRGQETKVNLSDIAVPTGTANFDVTPEDAVVYVSGNKIDGRVYTNLYGSYGIKVEADGYKTFRGSFNIDDSVKTFTIKLKKLEGDDKDDDTTDTGTGSDTGTNTGTPADTSSATDSSTTGSSTQTDNRTGNVITIKAPSGAGVYYDGDYVGTVPVSIPKETGTHTITLYQTGCLIKSYTIQPKDDGKDDEYSFAALTSLPDLIE